MPRTKGSKNRPKTTTDYATPITEKKSEITTLSTEIASIQKVIEEQMSRDAKSEKSVSR